MLNIDQHAANRRGHTGIRGNDDDRDVEFARNVDAVERTSSAERHQREVAWVVPPGNRDQANRVGPFRMALLVDDIDTAHAELMRAGVACWTPPATLDMGPGLPTVRALLFPDPDGTVLELIEAPTV